MKCPQCGSDNIIAETKVSIWYNLNEIGTASIISEWNDLTEQIHDKVAHNFECLDCGCNFYKFTKEKGAKLK